MARADPSRPRREQGRHPCARPPRGDGARESELVVHAELDRMDLLVDVGRGSGREGNGARAEIHEVIFEVQRPRGSERLLNTCANEDACPR